MSGPSASAGRRFRIRPPPAQGPRGTIPASPQDRVAAGGASETLYPRLNWGGRAKRPRRRCGGSAFERPPVPRRREDCCRRRSSAMPAATHLASASRISGGSLLKTLPSSAGSRSLAKSAATNRAHQHFPGAGLGLGGATQTDRPFHAFARHPGFVGDLGIGVGLAWRRRRNGRRGRCHLVNGFDEDGVLAFTDFGV